MSSGSSSRSSSSSTRTLSQYNSPGTPSSGASITGHGNVRVVTIKKASQGSDPSDPASDSDDMSLALERTSSVTDVRFRELHQQIDSRLAKTMEAVADQLVEERMKIEDDVEGLRDGVVLVAERLIAEENRLKALQDENLMLKQEMAKMNENLEKVHKLNTSEVTR